jgi:4-diphosphocytidyl-2-C-methyl-D-erythritol kinase
VELGGGSASPRCPNKDCAVSSARPALAPAVVLAPAKLTRRLRVVGVRPDGFHLLEAEMVTVSLFDRLEIAAGGNSLTVTDEVEWSGGTTVVGAGEATSHRARRATSPAGPGQDLVERALGAVDRQALVSLTKHIPSGAGLGGGSADAAAVLRWAGCSDLALAAEIGADVPFCVVGGRAVVSGIGEAVRSQPFESRHLVLVAPRIHVSTPAVYAAWDDLGGPSGERGNDLEPAAVALEPRLRFWRDLVEEVAGTRPSLAGSGGTWWLDTGDNPSRARLLETELREAVVASGESALVKAVETVPA